MFALPGFFLFYDRPRGRSISIIAVVPKLPQIPTIFTFFFLDLFQLAERRRALQPTYTTT